WQATILHELYTRTLARLTGGRRERPSRTQLADRLRQAVGEDLPAQAVKAHLAMMADRYLATAGVQRMAEHLQMLQALGNTSVVTELFHHPDLGSSDLVVVTRDLPGLFSLIAGTLASQGVNIISAQIHTRGDGIAIDTFQVNDPVGEAITSPAYWGRTLDALGRVLTGEAPVAALLEKRRAAGRAAGAGGGRRSSRRSSSRSDDARPLPRAYAHLDRPDRARALSPVPPAPEPSDDHRARGQPPGRDGVLHRADPYGRHPPHPGRALRLLRRLAGARLRPGLGVRGISRLGHRSLLRPGRAARDRRALRPGLPHARRYRRDGRAHRLDDGELHEGAGRVDRRAVHRGHDGAPGAHDLSDPRRPARPARAGALGPR